MSITDRRRTTVTLFSGQFEAELSDLFDRASQAQVAEATQPKRASTKSEAMRLAKEWDDKRAEAEKTARKVLVWAISYTHFGPLQDEHPPREDEAEDQVHGANMKTFPLALLKAALVTPADDDTVEQLKAKGEAALEALGGLSQVQYKKLELAAWAVNVGDDALPKFSLVSLLQQQRDPDSKQPNASQ